MIKQVIYSFVRIDMPLGSQMAQLGHACIEAGNEFDQPEETPTIVILWVENEKELLKVSEKLTGQGVKFKLFHEPDFPQGHTALCTEPVSQDQRKYFKRYRLWS